MFIKIKLFYDVWWFAGYDTDGTILKSRKASRIEATDTDLKNVQKVCNNVELGGMHICEAVYE